MGGSEAPAVRIPAEAGRARTFLLAEKITEIRPVAGAGHTEPKDEFVRARWCSRFRRERGKNALVQRLGRAALQGPGPCKFR